MSETQQPAAPEDAVPEVGAQSFVEATAMEQDRSFLFDGDRGELPYDARRALALLLQRRFIEAAENELVWQSILRHQNVLEARFHDMFLELVVDRNYGIAYKLQIREDGLNIPILVKDESYKRIETLLLVNLRNGFRQQLGQGQSVAFVDGEELIDFALSFTAAGETNLASRQSEAALAVSQLAREGILREVEPGRFRISPVIEVLMPIERLRELASWLHAGGDSDQLESGDSDQLESGDSDQLEPGDSDQLEPGDSDQEASDEPAETVVITDVEEDTK